MAPVWSKNSSEVVLGSKLLVRHSLERSSAKWFRMFAAMMAATNDLSLLRLEYIFAENKTTRKHIPGGVKLDDSDRRKLAEFEKKQGRQVLEEIDSIVTSDTNRVY